MLLTATPLVKPFVKPVRALGGFFGMTLDVCVGLFTTPLAWREYLAQSWFVARVSVLPAVLIFLLAQKHYIKGIAAGAGKG